MDDTDAGSPRLSLSADGVFVTTGRFTGMCGSLHNVLERRSAPLPGQWEDDPVFGPGTGRWIARSFSLLLDHHDGRILQYALQTGSIPDVIELNEARLVRVV